MTYFFKNSEYSSDAVYSMDSIGTDVTVKDTVVEVFSSMGEDWSSDSQKAIAHGVLLTVTALAVEGMSDLLKDPRFEHCIKCALDRIPDLSDTLDNESI